MIFIRFQGDLDFDSHRIRPVSHFNILTSIRPVSGRRLDLVRVKVGVKSPQLLFGKRLKTLWTDL